MPLNWKWCNPDGTEQWYTGRILSVVPGTTEWFNVQYDGEQEVLSLNLYTDIDNGDLDIIGQGYSSFFALPYSVDTNYIMILY